MRPWIRSLWNILPKRPLRDDFPARIQFYPPKTPLWNAFLAQHTILSAQKSPAGRLSDLRNLKKDVSWYLVRLWYMKSEAFPYNNSFEHSPKPSKHPNHTVFNDSNVTKMSFSKKCWKSILTGATIRKKYAEFNGDVRFGWNLQKQYVFDTFHFCHFWYFEGRKVNP